MSESIAAVGAILAGVKVNQTQPDETVLVLKVPGEFKAVALQLGQHVGDYFPAIAFCQPVDREDEA